MREMTLSFRDQSGKVPAQTTCSAESLHCFLAACRCFPGSVKGTLPVFRAAAGGSSRRAAAEREAAAVALWEPPGESKEFSLDSPMGVRDVLRNALELAAFLYISAKE